VSRRSPAVRRLALACLAGLAIGLAVAIVAGEPSEGEPDPAPSGGWGFVRSVPGDRAVVWAVGDGADGSEHGKAVAARIARGPVDRLLYLGDVYESGTAEDFADEYRTTYGRLARVTAPTSGNHDSRNETTGYDPYWRRVHGVRPPDWYRFRAGGWEILALDSEAPHHRGSAQHRWLRRQVRRPGTCRIAFWHRPRFSASVRHGDQGDMEAVVDTLRGRAAIVVGGHDHDMQRFRPIDGITHFVSGAGGRGRYDVRRDPRLAFSDDSHFGALRLDLRAGAAAHAFIAADGRVLDSGTVRCRPGR
jgi:calcineurin-like phosphoesterase family protein